MKAEHSSELCTCIEHIYASESAPVHNDINVASLRAFRKSFFLPVEWIQSTKQASTRALLDSGAHSSHIHPHLVKQHQLVTKPLAQELHVQNADGTNNKGGKITHYTRLKLRIGNHNSYHTFYVTNVGHHPMILGMDFLRIHNPEIDWKEGTCEFTRCPEICTPSTRLIQDEDLDEIKIPHLEDMENDWLGTILTDDEEAANPFIQWHEYQDDEAIRQVYATVRNLDTKRDIDSAPKSEQDKDYWSSLVPKHYHEYGDVFSQKASERMPTRKPWDHPIELLPDTALPKAARTYDMNPAQKNSLGT